MSPRTDLPEKIGHYEILGIVGEGAMGVIYRAHDSFSDRDVAIKTTHLASGDDDDAALARKMLLNEAHAASVLDHGAILQVFEAGEDAGEPYVVMEYVAQARTLREFISSSNKLPVPRVCAIIYACARALGYAHGKGVIHRDIKASNLLLDRNGKVKIGDFGIAKLETSDVTEILGTLGSPRYMSPEQILDKEITPATDLYSLGIVMYELLSAQPAFDARGFAQLSAKILTRSPPALDELRDDLPPELVALVHRAISKQVADRFHDGAEMATAIAAIFPALEQSPATLALQVRFEMLRGLGIFDEFSDEHLLQIAERATWQRYLPNERVIREGDMGQSFYVVVSGELAVNKGGKRIAILHAGDCCGELGYLTRTPRSASVRSRDDTITMALDATVMYRFNAECQARFRDVFIRIISERLASTTERLSKYLSEPGTDV